eukprot:3936032-Pyramimonas_sp.AAC.1
MHSGGVKADARALFGEQLLDARIIQCIMGDEMLMATDTGQEPNGVFHDCVIGAPVNDASAAEG